MQATRKQERYSEEGKGFIPILILVVVAAVIAVLFISKGSTSPSPAREVAPSSAPVVEQPKSDVTLMVDPATVATTANQSFSVNVNVDSKTDVITAVDLHLSYDNNYLNATSIKEGTILPVVLAPGKVAAGSATIVVGVNPTSPQKVSGVIATVTFKAKKTGTTQIKIDNATQVAAVGKTGSVLGSVTDTSVTIK